MDTLNIAIQLAIVLIFINSKFNSMSQEFTDLKNLIAQLKGSLAAIRADVKRLADKVPATGGLTAEEAAELKADLTTVAGDAADIDAQTAEDEVEPAGA